MVVKIDSKKLADTLTLCMHKAYEKTKRGIKFHNYAQRERLDSVEDMLHNFKVEVNNAIKDFFSTSEDYELFE